MRPSDIRDLVTKIDWGEAVAGQTPFPDLSYRRKRRGETVQFRTQWDDANPGAPYGFPLSELYAGMVRPISKPGSVYIQVFGGSTFGHHKMGVPQFFLGEADVAMCTNSPHAAPGREQSLLHVGLRISESVLRTSASHLPNDGAVSLASETFVGPLFVGGSWGDSEHRELYFTLGRFF